MLSTIYVGQHMRESFFGRYVLFWTSLFGDNPRAMKMISRIWDRQFFDNSDTKTLTGEAGKQLAAVKWAEWVAKVKRIVPPAQLLVLDIDKGELDWAPLWSVSALLAFASIDRVDGSRATAPSWTSRCRRRHSRAPTTLVCVFSLALSLFLVIDFGRLSHNRNRDVQGAHGGAS